MLVWFGVFCLFGLVWFTCGFIVSYQEFFLVGSCGSGGFIVSESCWSGFAIGLLASGFMKFQPCRVIKCGLGSWKSVCYFFGERDGCGSKILGT